jgi:hypothetical protein
MRGDTGFRGYSKAIMTTSKMIIIKGLTQALKRCYN